MVVSTAQLPSTPAPFDTMAMVFFEDGIIPACIPSIDDESTWPSVITPDPDDFNFGPAGTYDERNLNLIYTKHPPFKEGMIALTAQELCYVYWKIKQSSITEADIDCTISSPFVPAPYWPAEWGVGGDGGDLNFGISASDLSPSDRTEATTEAELVCLKKEISESELSLENSYFYQEGSNNGYSEVAFSKASPFFLSHKFEYSWGGHPRIGGFGTYADAHGGYYANYQTRWFSAGGNREIPNIWYDKDDKLFYWCPSFMMEVVTRGIRLNWNNQGHGMQGPRVPHGATVQACPIAPEHFPAGVNKGAFQLVTYYPDSEPYNEFSNRVDGAYSYGVTAAVGSLSLEFMGKQKSCPLNLCAWVKLSWTEPQKYTEYQNTTMMTEWSGTANATISEVSTWGYES